MSDNQERLSFSDACRELQVSEDELEKLVASGEIASVKEGDTIFFKPEAISQFKKSRKTEPTIILSDDEMDLLDGVEEINLDEFDIPDEEEQPVAAAQASASSGTEKHAESDDTGDDSDEELELEDLDISGLSLEDDDSGAESDDESSSPLLAKDVGGDDDEKSDTDETSAESGGGSDDDDDDDDFAELTLEGGDVEELSLDDDSGDDTGEGEDAGKVGDDTVLSLDGLLDDEDEGGTESTTPVPGADVGDLDLDEGGDDLTLEGSVSEDTILDTDVLELTDEDDDFQLDEGGDEDLDAASSTLIRGGGPRTMQMQRAGGNPAWTFLLLLTGLLMFAPLAVLIAICYFSVPGDVTTVEVSQWVREANVFKDFVDPIAETVYGLISGN